MKNKNQNNLALSLIQAHELFQKKASQTQGKGICIICAGTSFSGMQNAVHKLRQTIDPKGLIIYAEPNKMRGIGSLFWQPYVSHIPEQGKISILMMNWYQDLLVTAVHQKNDITEEQIQDQLEKIKQFEDDLNANDVEIIKFWFDLPYSDLIRKYEKSNPELRDIQQQYGLDWVKKEQYQKLQQVRHMFTENHGWIEINDKKNKQRNQVFLNHVLNHIYQANSKKIQLKEDNWKSQPVTSSLENSLLQQPYSQSDYKIYFEQLSQKVINLIRKDPRKIILVFEGMDASGKGGIIERILKYADPIEYAIHSIAAPNPTELKHPYLWRFWSKVQHKKLTIFDRSWYGRVLVERIEGFASFEEWQRAYAEINRFEQSLIHENHLVIKFWLSISKDEQRKRFEARAFTPEKQFKITEEDWRNRAKWSDYLVAASDMLKYTDTSKAPWIVVTTDDKKTARLSVLNHIVDQIKNK